MNRETIWARMVAAFATVGMAALAMGAGLASGATSGDQFKPVTQDRLLRAAENPSDWLIYGGNYAATWYTPLKQIDTTNVGTLAPAWAFSMGVLGGQDGIPVVNNGVMYITSAWSKLFALDARTGTLLWMYEADLPENISGMLCCDVVNRGVAVLGDRVFWATLDGHLLALDAQSGKVIWNVAVADWEAGYTLTAAPLIVKNKVLIGPAAVSLEFADSSSPTTPIPARKRGRPTQCRLPANRAARLGRGTPKLGATGAAQRGSPVPTIPISTSSTGVRAILRRFSTALTGTATISTPARC